jgi:hypothetical protein
MAESKFNIKERQEFKCPCCKKTIVRHIHKEGSREHVIHWTADKGQVCSEPDCETNHGIGKCTPPKKKRPYRSKRGPSLLDDEFIMD